MQLDNFAYMKDPLPVLQRQSELHIGDTRLDSAWVLIRGERDLRQQQKSNCRYEQAEDTHLILQWFDAPLSES